RLTFRVVGDDGTVLATGKDLAELRTRFAKRTRAAVAAAVTESAPELERTGLRDWPGDALPREGRREGGGEPVTGYPALVDAGDAVDVRVLSTAAEQAAAMWAGTRRLLTLTVPSPVRQIRRTLSRADALALSQSPHGSLDALLDDCQDCAV